MTWVELTLNGLVHILVSCKHGYMIGLFIGLFQGSSGHRVLRLPLVHCWLSGIQPRASLRILHLLPRRVWLVHRPAYRRLRRPVVSTLENARVVNEIDDCSIMDMCSIAFHPDQLTRSTTD